MSSLTLTEMTAAAIEHSFAMEIDMANTALPTAMDVDMADPLAMDIDMAEPTAAAADEEMDLLSMKLDYILADLANPVATTTAARKTPGRRSRGHAAKYYSGFRALWRADPTTGLPIVNYAVLHRSVRHIEATLRELGSLPYDDRRAACKQLYGPFTHLSQTLTLLQDLVDDDEIRTYVRHMKRLHPIVMAFGSAKDFSRCFAGMERIRLPNPTRRVLKLRLKVGGEKKTDVGPCEMGELDVAMGGMSVW